MKRIRSDQLKEGTFVKQFLLSPYENLEPFVLLEKEENIYLQNHTGPHCLK